MPRTGHARAELRVSARHSPSGAFAKSTVILTQMQAQTQTQMHVHGSRSKSRAYARLQSFASAFSDRSTICAICRYSWLGLPRRA